MTEELPGIIKNEYGIDIKKMSMDGTAMVVDLNKNMELALDKGSAHAMYTLAVLYKSLLERDNVKAVKVLIDGREGVEGNHYSFRTPAVLGSDGRTEVERYFKVTPQSIVSKVYNYDKINLEEVIKNEILTRNYNAYKEYEVQTEGHKILKTAQEGGHTIVYMIVSEGEFGFENGIFTKVSGSGAIPTVLTFAKNGKGEYILEDYKVPEDGSRYGTSIRKMFPFSLQKDAFNADKFYGELKFQEEAYAKEYLKTIGRNAVVQANHVDKRLADINVNVSNKLLEMYSEYPYWIGTFEKLENGQRYVYEKTFKDKGNGNGIVGFIKKKYSGETVEKTIIEVKNGKMTYLEGKKREEGHSKYNR